jgi:AGCS family alanine or glycine:cation symporter
VDIGITDENFKNSFFELAGFKVNTAKLIIGTILMIISGVVILGGISRIGNWAGKMVPLMIILYFLSVAAILILNIGKVPHYFMMILTDAFAAEHYKGTPVLGGLVGGMIVAGVRRASFSNEAGIGNSADGIRRFEKQGAHTRRPCVHDEPAHRYPDRVYVNGSGHFGY